HLLDLGVFDDVGGEADGLLGAKFFVELLCCLQRLWTSGDAPQHETSGTASEILQETSVHAGWLVFGEVAEFVTRDLLDQLQFNIVNHWSHVSVSPLCYTSIPWRLASSSRIRFICAARTLRSVLCASTSSRQAMRRAASAATGKA